MSEVISNSKEYGSIDNQFPGRRRLTSTAQIQSTISHPGTVRINVQGAFIVDDDGSRTPLGSPNEDYKHDINDIRLPNHTELVSHVAVDVCASSNWPHITHKQVTG